MCFLLPAPIMSLLFHTSTIAKIFLMYCCNFLRRQSFLCNNYNICFFYVQYFLIFHIQSCNISNNYIHFVQKQGMYSTYPVLYHIKHFSLVFTRITYYCTILQLRPVLSSHLHPEIPHSELLLQVLYKVLCSPPDKM